MTGSFKVACVQTNSGCEIQPNIEAVSGLVRQARAKGADLITLPECVTMVERRRRRLLEKALREAEHPGLPAFRRLARETGAWLLVGSMTIKLSADQVANRSYLFDGEGGIVARYDKIHMFDVDLAGGESYRESAYVRPGARAQLAATPWGLIGMTVCYDLRFAHLYRALAQAGASFLAVPAAFTAVTGRAHWHVLLRARAIENQCYVLAAAQGGRHENGRRTWGHSMLIDPWGEIIASVPEGEGVAIGDMDPARIAQVRRDLPALKHRVM